MTKSTGRYIIVGEKTYVVEPILPRAFRVRFGNDSIDPTDGGAIHESDSIVTEANGFKNIVDLQPGQSPEEFLRQLKMLSAQ